MTQVIDTIADLIGNTPLLRLARLSAHLPGDVLAKLEMFNPSGSDMDRVVQELLDRAEATGQLEPSSVIIEPTSGNIGFSLAMLAVARGYRVILVMPEGLPAWRIDLLRAMGAKVELSPAAHGMLGARSRADSLAKKHPSVFRPNQFSNPTISRAYHAIADEIWQATGGQVAAVVVGVSTGSMITGIGQRFKALSKGKVRIVAVQPASSPVLTGGKPAAHRLFGMGTPFIPANYDPKQVDELISISDTECNDTLLRLYRHEGLISGPTGGAVIAAALEVASRPDFAQQQIVAIIPDNMQRYAGLRFWQPFQKLLMPTLVAG